MAPRNVFHYPGLLVQMFARDESETCLIYLPTSVAQPNTWHPAAKQSITIRIFTRYVCGLVLAARYPCRALPMVVDGDHTSFKSRTSELLITSSFTLRFSFSSEFPI